MVGTFGSKYCGSNQTKPAASPPALDFEIKSMETWPATREDYNLAISRREFGHHANKRANQYIRISLNDLRPRWLRNTSANYR